MAEKKVVILGAGESGIGAALLAHKLGKYDVFVSDYGKIEEKYRQELEDHHISFEERKHSFDIIGKSDLIIKSPGIAEKNKVMQFVRQKKIPVISEIEFAYRHCNARIIAITGSNGKTTTTELSYHLLHSAKLDVEKAGNVGKSFARAVSEGNAAIYVLEISSFQLDDIQQFRADIAVLLNITPDHLDRYGNSLDAYADAKFAITNAQDTGDVFMVNMDDVMIEERINKQSWSQTLIKVRYPKDKYRFVTTVSNQEFDMTKANLQGKHNLFNACVAANIAELMSIDKESIQEGLISFQNIPHRMEKIARIDGVQYINDSKATNVDAVFFALESMTAPVIWIAGGKDKGNDYTALDTLVKDKVKALICLGVNNEKLIDHFSPVVSQVKETQDVGEAVNIAASLAKEGWVVLMSPACASFDLFKNYEDRGDRFKNAVWQLLEK